jgi:hypothetical protein
MQGSETFETTINHYQFSYKDESGKQIPLCIDLKSHAITTNLSPPTKFYPYTVKDIIPYDILENINNDLTNYIPLQYLDSNNKMTVLYGNIKENDSAVQHSNAILDMGLKALENIKSTKIIVNQLITPTESTNYPLNTLFYNNINNTIYFTENNKTYYLIVNNTVPCTVSWTIQNDASLATKIYSTPFTSM